MNPTPTPDVEGIALVAIAQVHRVIVVNGLRPLNNSHDTAMAAAIRAYVAACVTHQRVATQAHETMNQHIEQTRQRLDADHAWSPALREKVAQADAHALAARKEWDAMMGTPHADHPHRPVPVVSTADTPDPAGLVTGASVAFTHTMAVRVNDLGEIVGADIADPEVTELMDELAPREAVHAVPLLHMALPAHGIAQALAEAQRQMLAVGEIVAEAHGLLGRCSVALSHRPDTAPLRADVSLFLRRHVS